MTQSVFALALRRTPDDPLSGLTATRFVETVMRLGAASRNTATGYLAELVAYKFLRDVPEVPDKRVRVLEPTELSLNGLRSWFNGHLACLDRLDGGNREMTSLAEERIFLIAQPLGADLMVGDPIWRDPPDTIGHFLWSDLGGIILHDLISRLDHVDRSAAVHSCGPVSLTDLSETYQVSTTNLKRMFKKAETENLLHWEQPRRRGDLMLSSRFVEDYFGWQSAKFAAVDLSYHQALAELGIKTADADSAAA
jgi:AraC-like DNA-binding protein